MYNSEYFQNQNETNIMGNNNAVNETNEIDVNMTMPNNATTTCPRERVVHRTFVHEVPHTCPVHTRIINHHVYKHTYRPVYTCSEENVCSNVQCGSCSQYQ
ncbi:MAG: hypothetical protein IKF71_05535 [Bacilli bacterium]|nr:hypothetical protein [Bacilli bacterium]